MTSDTSLGVSIQFIGRASPTAPRVGAGGHPCQGLYWTAPGERPKTALIATHYNVDFAEHYSAPYFAARGFGFLGWNTRYRGAEDQFILEHALIDIGVGVRWLREEAGVERVVILGNSGGGSLMGAYQAEAAAPTLAGGMRGPAAEALASLPGADLYVSLNAHKGRPEVLTDWMDRLGGRRARSHPDRPGARSVQSGQRAALLGRVRRDATGPRRTPATSASPTGRKPSWRG